MIIANIGGWSHDGLDRFENVGRRLAHLLGADAPWSLVGYASSGPVMEPFWVLAIHEPSPNFIGALVSIVRETDQDCFAMYDTESDLGCMYDKHGNPRVGHFDPQKFTMFFGGSAGSPYAIPAGMRCYTQWGITVSTGSVRCRSQRVARACGEIHEYD